MNFSGCGGLFHSQNRIIQTPSFPDDYPNNAECLWELRSDEGYHIGLTFMTRFQIEQSDNCENDFVEIWDWRNDEWFSLGKKCGREIPESINATSNRMKILFRSNERIGGKGFRVGLTSTAASSNFSLSYLFHRRSGNGTVEALSSLMPLNVLL